MTLKQLELKAQIRGYSIDVIKDRDTNKTLYAIISPASSRADEKIIYIDSNMRRVDNILTDLR